MRKPVTIGALTTILGLAAMWLVFHKDSRRPDARRMPKTTNVTSPATNSHPVELPVVLAPPPSFTEIFPPPPPPPPPVVLPKRQPGRKLNPTQEEVQAIMARARRGPEHEPEFSKLHAELMTLDYRAYPEEFAEMIGGPGYFSNIWVDRKREFHANDSPEFLAAVFAYFNREQPRLSPPSRYFDFIELFGRMTNSPALVPPLIKGLESGDFRVVAACASSLAALPTAESARALLAAAKSTREVSPDPELPIRGTLAICIGRLRNAELIPLLEAELAQTKDELMAAQLKHAIMKSRL